MAVSAVKTLLAGAGIASVVGKRAKEKRMATEASVRGQVSAAAINERTARLKAQAARDRLLTGNPNILSADVGGPATSGRLLGN